MHTIAIQGLTKRYGDKTAVDEMSLDIKEGSIFGFLGPNGAGKSTTIRVLLGLLKPTSGSATVLGHDAWRDSAKVKADVGYIGGDFRFYPSMSLQSALTFAGKTRGRSIMGNGLELAERFELDDAVPARAMSRGMRQKLGLILALAHRPKLLVLDEPTTALDPPMQTMLYECLRERAAEGGTVFFSSHTLSEVEQLCERVAIVRQGKLVENDSLPHLRERAARIVTVTWPDEEHALRPVPDTLKVREQSGVRWVCELDGPIRDLLQWAAHQPLVDFTVGRPDLERLFRSYYEG